ARKSRKLMYERIDDIQDDSSLRRGKPAAHTAYGIAQTINSANHAYFLAQRELLNLGEASTMVKIFNEELVNLHQGQGIDIYWRDKMKDPNGRRAGGLFRLAMRLMQAVSKRRVDLVPLVDLLGLIFQIQDDYLNLTSQSVSTTNSICRAEADVHQMTSSKGFCDDLEEGKFSFPVIHAIRNDPSETEWMLETLRRRPRDVSLYGKNPSTLLYSLEGLIGKIDFDRIAHHKVQGCMLLSPSSTAAYLMNTSHWDTEAESYLRKSMQICSVPEVYPTNLFEISWVCGNYTLSYPILTVLQPLEALSASFPTHIHVSRDSD
ncbi:MAG: hypothetical protein Q9180_009076, partial [Flavoplaca navasiana]